MDKLVVPHSGQGTLCRFCPKTAAKRDRGRILRHASVCKGIKDTTLKISINKALKKLSPMEKLAAAMAADPTETPSQPLTRSSSAISSTSISKSSPTPSQPSVYNISKNAASNKRNLILDAMLVMLIACQAISSRFLDNPYTRAFFMFALPDWKLPSRTSWETVILPAEAASIRKKMLDMFKNSINLTLSFDGWESRAKDSIYTITVTTAERLAYLFHFHSVTTESHTGEYIAKFLLEVSD